MLKLGDGEKGTVRVLLVVLPLLLLLLLCLLLFLLLLFLLLLLLLPSLLFFSFFFFINRKLCELLPGGDEEIYARNSSRKPELDCNSSENDDDMTHGRVRFTLLTKRTTNISPLALYFSPSYIM